MPQVSETNGKPLSENWIGVVDLFKTNRHQLTFESICLTLLELVNDTSEDKGRERPAIELIEDNCGILKGVEKIRVNGFANDIDLTCLLSKMKIIIVNKTESYCSTYVINSQNFCPDEHKVRPQLYCWTLKQP